MMSRYYDPVTHRFINADGYFQSGGNILDANMHSYCRNNPIIYADPTGTTTLYQLLENLAFSETCNYNIDFITQLQKAGYDWNDEITFIFNYNVLPVAFGSVKVTNYKGWSWRIDVSEYSKTHIHIFKGNKKYSQNIDGSPHDGSTGSPPNSVKKYLKEQNIWDWDANKNPYEFQQNELSENFEMMQLMSQYHFVGMPVDVSFAPITLPQFSASFSGYYFSGYCYVL